MFPLVSCQLVRPGEPPATAFPLTHVGFLPGVGPEVSLEVAGLGVRLAAVVEGARVDDDLPPAQPPPASLLERDKAGLVSQRVEAGGGRW